jgi:hypothetical protein
MTRPSERSGGSRGKRQTSEVVANAEHPVNAPLARLIDAWCERRALGPLAVLLPAYTSNNGLTDGWAGVMEALRTLRGSRRLPDEERDEVGRLVVLVENMVNRT